MRDRVIWCDNWQYPLFYGFCPSAKAWDNEMVRLDVKEPPPYPGDLHGSCNYFQAPNGNQIALVTISAEPKRALTKAALIVHEATHVFQQLCRIIGERKPSKEFEAYTMQMITTNLIMAFERSRGPLMTKGKVK